MKRLSVAALLLRDVSPTHVANREDGSTIYLYPKTCFVDKPKEHWQSQGKRKKKKIN